MLVELQNGGANVAFREGNWKLLPGGGQRNGQKGSPKAALYNLAEDLSEKNDLAAAQPERVAAMLAKLVRSSASCPASR